MSATFVHTSAPSSNSNCLEGVRCPKCGWEDSFEIDALTTATMRDEGSDNYGTEYDHTTRAACNACGLRDYLAAFYIEPSERAQADLHLLRLCDEVGTPFLSAFMMHIAQSPLVSTDDVLAMTVEDVRRIASRTLAPVVSKTTTLLAGIADVR